MRCWWSLIVAAGLVGQADLAWADGTSTSGGGKNAVKSPAAKASPAKVKPKPAQKASGGQNKGKTGNTTAPQANSKPQSKTGAGAAEKASSKSQVMSAGKAQFKDDLMAIAQGARKPSQESVSKLAGDLQAAAADKHLSPKEQVQLVNDVAKVLNSAGIPPEEIQTLITHAHDLLTASGVTKQDAQTIAEDLLGIATEVGN